MVQRDITKGELHPNNPHRGGYMFEALVEAYAPLEQFVAPNKFGTQSINFFDPEAVKALNAALLALHYGIEWWELPPSALTPPIPGRADYIHYIADLVGPEASRCLDIGVGANCIYPIIGRSAYGWEFVGSDISKHSIDSARKIVEHNTLLQGGVELRHQDNSNKIFEGVIKIGESFDVTICNPPFHASEQDAQRAAQRKLRALKAPKQHRQQLNFAGSANELWCRGGERQFVSSMIDESQSFATQCRWFTSLISNEDNLRPLSRLIREVGATEQRVIDMYQGNKRSRILAWRY
ncbi:MAG: 23S rRNA (adenine(1618)-N(6))-methyltransferase RlmF [Rikenellaceae bacterium]